MRKQKYASSPFLCGVHLAVSTVLAAALFIPLETATAQGVPHLSVNPSAYHTLVQPGTLITAEMCPTGNIFCVPYVVGNPLFSTEIGDRLSYAVGPLGDIYIADSDAEILVKVTPTGQPTIVAGEYNLESFYDAPLSSPASSTTFGPLTSLAVDHAGNVYIGSQPYSPSVRKLDKSGTVHRLTAAQGVSRGETPKGSKRAARWVVGC
jgi:hypothetical protein